MAPGPERPGLLGEFMTTHAHAAAGGQFVTESLACEDLFTREDLTEEQRLFGRTAAEFIEKEVLPVVKQLYAHDWALTRKLLTHAGELDLLRLEVPPKYGGNVAVRWATFTRIPSLAMRERRR